MYTSKDAQFMADMATRAAGMVAYMANKADYAKNASMAAWYRRRADEWAMVAERQRMEANAIEAEYREERARLVAAAGAM